MPNTMTADQLRVAIDSGEAGDKVAFSDPALAPLGTDDEAAGSSPSKHQIQLAAQQELRASQLRSNKAIEGFPVLYLVIIVPLAIAILTIVWTGASAA